MEARPARRRRRLRARQPGRRGRPVAADRARRPAARPRSNTRWCCSRPTSASRAASYGIGVEPSGRTLFKQVTAPLDGDAEVIVPGTAVERKSRRQERQVSSRPTVGCGCAPAARSPGRRGVDDVRRHRDERARSRSSTIPASCAARAGSCVSTVRAVRARRRRAAGDAAHRAERLQDRKAWHPRNRRWTARLSTARRACGYVGASVPYYDRDKKTQLLALIRPKVVEGRP